VQEDRRGEKERQGIFGGCGRSLQKAGSDFSARSTRSRKLKSAVSTFTFSSYTTRPALARYVSGERARRVLLSDPKLLRRRLVRSSCLLLIRFLAPLSSVCLSVSQSTALQTIATSTEQLARHGTLIPMHAQSSRLSKILRIILVSLPSSPPELRARLEGRVQRQHVLHGRARVSQVVFSLSSGRCHSRTRTCRQFPFQRDRRTRLTRVVRTERGTLGRHAPLPRDIRGMADTWHHVSSPHCEHGEQPRGYSTTSCDLPVVARPHAHER